VGVVGPKPNQTNQTNQTQSTDKSSKRHRKLPGDPVSIARVRLDKSEAFSLASLITRSPQTCRLHGQNSLRTSNWSTFLDSARIYRFLVGLLELSSLVLLKRMEPALDMRDAQVLLLDSFIGGTTLISGFWPSWD